MTRAIVFDLDGTLVDSAAVCADIFSGMMAERGCRRRVRAFDVQGSLSVGGVHMVHVVMGDFCSDAHKDLAEFRKRYQDMPTPEGSLYPGVREMLMALRHEGYALGLCTKKPHKLATKVLEELELRHYFDHVSGGDSTAHPKPDARHLLEVLRALNVDSAQTWMVGDSSVDAELARNASVRFAFATYGYGAQQVSRSQCALMFDSAEELLDGLNVRRSASAGMSGRRHGAVAA